MSKQHKFQAWRPPVIRDGRLDFTACATPGHVVLGIYHHDHPAHGFVGTSLLAMGVERRASGIVLGEVLSVGDGCPGLRVGDVAIAQRSSAAGRLWPGLVEPKEGYIAQPTSGYDPTWFTTVADAYGLAFETVRTASGDDVPRFVAYHLVRAGNAIPAQSEGNDAALVDAGLKVAAVKALMRRKYRGEPDMNDPKVQREAALLAGYEAEQATLMRSRIGRAVNVAPVRAGIGTGLDGSVFDGVIAVLESAQPSA